MEELTLYIITLMYDHPKMNEMKSIIEMGFRRFRLKMEQERTLYSYTLGYNVFFQSNYSRDLANHNS